MTGMADNAFVTQGLYLGVEATRGTSVPATKRVVGFDLTSKIDATAQEFRPLGSKFVTVDALQQEWTSGTIGGAVCYTELPYLLSSVMSQSPTPVQTLDGTTATGAYKWVFDSNAFDVDNPVTYTVEQGNSVRARKFTYALLSDYSLSMARNAVTHSGTVMAQQHQDNITLTSTTASPLPSTSLTPVLASQVDVFVDPTFGALGTTRQSRIFKVDPNIGGRYKPVWPLDSSRPSWAAHVESANTATCNFSAEYDTQGAAFLAQLRVGSTQFMRVRAIGSAIYTGGITVNHSLTIDMAVKIKQTDAFADTDGVFAIGYGADIVYDSGWTKALHVEVVTSLASL